MSEVRTWESEVRFVKGKFLGNWRLASWVVRSWKMTAAWERRRSTLAGSLVSSWVGFVACYCSVGKSHMTGFISLKQGEETPGMTLLLLPDLLRLHPHNQRLPMDQLGDINLCQCFLPPSLSFLTAVFPHRRMMWHFCLETLRPKELVTSCVWSN